MPVPIRAILLLALWVAAPAGALAQADPDLHECRSGGFRVRRPGAGWSFRETMDPNGAAVEVQVNFDARAEYVRASVSSRPLPAGTTAAALRDGSLAAVRRDPEYSAVEPTERSLAGKTAVGLTVLRTVATGVFRIVQLYLVENGQLYGFLHYAPESEFARHADAFERIWASLAVLPPDGGLAERERLAALAARCGTEAAWAPDWAAAAARARAEKRAILVVACFVGPFQVTDPAPSGPFMDPDVLELVHERFVPFRLAPGVATPLADPDRYGMGASTFGLAWLVATPEGRVVRETFDLDERSLYPWLAGALAGRPEFAGPERAAPLDGAGRAELLLRRGEPAAALEATGDGDAPRLHRLRATAHRRLRRGDAALDDLRRAGSGAGAEERLDLRIDEAVVLARLGRFLEARGRLHEVAEARPAPAITARALYWLGAVDARLGGAATAGPTWRRLVDEYPAERWAWRAAAHLLSTTFSAGYGFPLAWPREEALALLEDVAAPPRIPEADPLRTAREAASRWLLDRQRPDGTWTHPSEATRDPLAPMNEFVDAVAALAADGLLDAARLPGTDAAPARAAADRALDFLVKSHERFEAFGDRSHFIDYGVWRQALVLSLFARCLRESVGDPLALRPACDSLIRALARKQKRRGGWSYYLSPDLGPGGAHADQSISFITATVLWALCDAKDAGVPGTAELAQAAGDCLERMRNPDGSFRYMMFHGSPDAYPSGGPGGDAGRGPLCALALERAGRGQPGAVRRALDVFLEHAPGLARERTKALLHTGPDGQGSHYVMFDYAWAARATRSLPADLRAPYVEGVSKLLLDARTEDGAFRDYPFNGPAYGAAMGLRALTDLAAESR